jgi:DNA-binding GntR family transcriptional regulator
MPVREALRRLESEGLVEIVRHRGALVRGLSVSDLEDLYVLRIALEGVASRLGTERLIDNNLQQMQDLLPEMTAIVAREDATAWLDTDWRFHSLLYAGCGHPRLLATIQSLREEAGRYRLIGIRQPKEFERSLESHHTILTAAARRDGAAVEHVIQAELARSRDRMRRMLEERQLATEAAAQYVPEEGNHGKRRGSR